MINRIYKDNLKINISTGFLCNYNCSYCIQKENKKVKNTVREINEQLDITTKNINLKLFSNEFFLSLIGYQVGFIGGEPTLYNLPKFIDNLTYNKKLKQINITTNLSADISFFKQLYDISLKNDFVLNLKGSYHYDMINYNDFFNKLKQLKELGKIKINCNFVVTNTIDKNTIYNFVKDCKKLNISYSLTPEKSPNDWKNNLINNDVIKILNSLKNKEEKGYTIEIDDKKIITNANGLLTKFKINSEPVLKGYRCYPNISIIYNGLFHRMCGDNQFNINDDDININDIVNYSIICNKDYCQACTFYKVENV